MNIYRTKAKRIPGTDFHEVRQKAFNYFLQIKKKSKRRTYVRSVYFGKEKIFLDIFWNHLFGKPNWKDRVRRMKYFPCALELIQYSRCVPISKINPNKPSAILHRFSGVTPNDEIFHVQIKENQNSGEKWLISIFPDK